MTRAAVCATDPRAQKAAERALSDGGSAADAVVSAYFAMAGATRSALFAPLTAIVAGPGTGGRAFDGRAAQPGLGVGRPRGFVAGSTIPMTARAAVPRALHAVLLLHSLHGRRALKKDVAAGVAEAKAAGAPLRAAFLARIGDSGAVAFGAERDAILRGVGQFASGLVTAADLEDPKATEVPTEIHDVRSSASDTARLYLEPWASPEEPERARSRAQLAHAVVAVDVRGLLVALSSHDSAPDGVVDGGLIPELDVALPLIGEPVRRGATRVTPGTIFPVRRSLATFDCGPDLRAAVAAPRGLDAARCAKAFAQRPIEEGLRKLGGRSVLCAVVATGRDARPLATRGAA